MFDFTYVEDIGKFVDGVLNFYSRYPIEGIKRLLGKDWAGVKKMIIYSPVIEGIHFTITPEIEKELVMSALRSFFTLSLLLPKSYGRHRR